MVVNTYRKLWFVYWVFEGGTSGAPWAGLGDCVRTFILSRSHGQPNDVVGTSMVLKNGGVSQRRRVTRLARIGDRRWSCHILWWPNKLGIRRIPAVNLVVRQSATCHSWEACTGNARNAVSGIDILMMYALCSTKWRSWWPEKKGRTKYYFLFLSMGQYSLISMRLIYYFRYLSHHLTWHCSSISEDLHRFARDLQHLLA